MERLRLADLRAVTGFLRELYELRELPSFQSQLIARLPMVVPCDVAIYCENNLKTKESRGLESRGFADQPVPFEGEAARIYGRHVHESPLLRAYRRGRGSAVKYSDFLSRQAFHRTGLYNEFFRPRGTEYRIAKGLPGPSGLVTSVYLDRSRRDFSERERLLLNLLRPHFNQGYQNAVMVSSMREELALVAQGVEGIDGGIVWLAADGRPRQATAVARRWLQEHFGVTGKPDSLPEAVTRWLARHDASSIPELPHPATPLVIERETSRLVIRLIARGSHRLLLLQKQAWGHTLRALESRGLTRREAEVLRWVANGKTNGETAIILGLSRRTVDKHLEHIYSKLGVETRTAAVACTRTISGDEV